MNGVEKLIPNLMAKEKYVLHVEKLKLYESLGLKVKQIHRGIKFKEEPWLEGYIDKNTELRTKKKKILRKTFSYE